MESSYKMAHDKYYSSEFYTWLIILSLVFLVLIKGYFSYYIVSDRGQPTWDYRPVPDIPSESPYAVYEVLPFSQHVKGNRGE